MSTIISIAEDNTTITLATTGIQGATGATGATGSSGVISVTSPITNSGTSTAANIGLNQTAITIAKTQVTGTAITAADTGTVTGTMISNGTINDIDINSGAAIAPSKIAGTAVITTDSRLSDTRTPTDGTVTNAKIISTGLDMSSINAGAITNWAASTSYTKGDLVAYNGVAYRRIATSVSGSTFDPANWNQMTPTVAKQVNSDFQPSTGIDIFPRLLASGTRALASGANSFMIFNPDYNLSVSNITTLCTTGGTDTGGTTTRRMGLFTVNPTTNAFTLVARTASDATLWNTSSTLYTRALDATGGYPTSYNLIAGNTYAVGVVAYNTGGTFGTPTLVGTPSLNSALTPLSPAMFGQLTGQTDLNTGNTITTGTSTGLWARLT